MATTATITPNQGSAPVTLQAGNYSAVDDRRFWGAGVREGVVNGGSYRVIQRAAGANMTVDVASSVGSGAIVQGDSITAQGNYFVPPTTADVNVDIATTSSCSRSRTTSTTLAASTSPACVSLPARRTALLPLPMRLVRTERRRCLPRACCSPLSGSPLPHQPSLRR